MSKQVYSPEFKEKCIKEYLEVGNMTSVCKANNIPLSTFNTWLQSSDHKKQKRSSQSIKREHDKLNKLLQEKDLEIQILKELLKKTNQAWLKD